MNKINDDNYASIKSAPRAALVVGTTTCKYCKDFEPVIDTISKSMPYINFGKLNLDEGRATQFKKEYKDVSSWNKDLYPYTILMKMGKEVARIKGFKQYPDALKEIVNNLVIGSDIYFSENGNIIQAKIKSIVNDIYILDAKGRQIQTKKEQIKWNLEDRL